MYYRRKIILGLLQIFDNELEKINLQKLLFLISRFQEKKDFSFVPYKYGCFSFQANADLKIMKNYNQIAETNSTWTKIDNTDYLIQLKAKDLQALKNVRNLYGNMNSNELIKITYQKYPFYAINSSIAKNMLSNEEYEKVVANTPKKKSEMLFTIGYEGISLEQYLNKLIINDIKVLCDVRKNAQSMKYGFSKKQLKNACEKIGIKYLHFPQVGIASDKRKELHSQSDYDKLFVQYKKTIIKNTVSTQNELLNLLQSNKRIALTCFEANINQCHRKHLAEAITKLPQFKYKLKHI